MAETAKPAPKRRRILDPSAIVPVPIYSNQVSRGLQLKAPAFTESKASEEAADDGFWSKLSSNLQKQTTVELSDSEDDVELTTRPNKSNSSEDSLRSPSPPPPESPVQKPSRKAKQKLSEIDRRLQAVSSLLSPVEESRRRRGRRSPRVRNKPSDVVILDEDDDVIIMSPEQSLLESPFRAERQIPLKVRCRADLHKITVQPSTPLSVVMETLSKTLGVPSSRLLLLREEAELSPDATVQELGLGIADIIECVVMADEANDAAAGDSDDIIRVRLQGKDRDSAQEFSLRRDAALGTVFSQYLSTLTGGARQKVRFHFDGSKLSPQQTPADLDMEDGDIIEVWA